MYQSLYNDKLVSPKQAVELVENQDTVVIGLATSEPPALLSALEQRLRGGGLETINLFYLFPLPALTKTLLAPDLCDQVICLTGFVSPLERNMVSVGINQFIPNYLYQVPRLLTEDIGVDVCLTTVSPMDEKGFFTFGAGNDYISTAAWKARTTIVEVNHNAPRVFGNSRIHVSQVAAVIENTAPMPWQAMPRAEPIDEVIAQRIVDMVPDGACIQLGAGQVPEAVSQYLSDHKDLGIHSELLGPGLLKLVEQGVVTGAKKNFYPHKHVFTFASLSQEGLDFLDNNRDFESYPVSYVNQPSVISQNDNLISINAILEVDLFGQANAETLGGQQFSGTGGQLDFVRGAYDSQGGKSILAFHSTAQKGTVSRIVPRLDPGNLVTTPRNDVHWLVTEHGAAKLKGKTLGQRALAIIDLAHPDFREELLRAAEDMRLL